MGSGIIYIAFGRKYVDEVVFSAQSLKRFSRIPVTLFTDVDIESPFLDGVVRIDPKHKRAKVDFIVQSPYERTLYLDSDTEVQRDISDLFDVLEKFDVAAVHDHSRKSSRWAKVIPEYAAIPYAFPEYNGGVLLYRRSEATAEFFRLWHSTFNRYKETTRGLDQASLRIALWESGVRIHSLPFEFNVRNQAIRERMRRRAGTPDDEGLLKPRILHWHGLNDKSFLGRFSPSRKPMSY